MHIHILTAEHFHVPGIITEAHISQSTATVKAVELVNLMLKDTRWEQDATAENWQAKIECLQEYHGAAHCYVEIVEHELIGAEVDGVNALVKAEEFIEGFEDDETQEGIADILAGLRTAIQRERVRPDLLGMLNEAVTTWPQFDAQTELPLPGVSPEDSNTVNGGDLVEWFGEWRARTSALVAKAEGRANG